MRLSHRQYRCLLLRRHRLLLSNSLSSNLSNSLCNSLSSNPCNSLSSNPCNSLSSNLRNSLSNSLRNQFIIKDKAALYETQPLAIRRLLKSQARLILLIKVVVKRLRKRNLATMIANAIMRFVLAAVSGNITVLSFLMLC